MWWKRVRIGLVVLASLLALYLMVGSVYLAGASYIDARLVELPVHASRSQVQRTLKHFRETKVTYADFPAGHEDAGKAARRPGYAAYRYDLVIKLLCVHVVYDPQGYLAYLIPTYE